MRVMDEAQAQPHNLKRWLSPLCAFLAPLFLFKAVISKGAPPLTSLPEALVVGGIFFGAPIAGLLLLFRSFTAGLLGRAILWCQLLWFTVVALVVASDFDLPFLWLSVSCGLALLLSDDARLERSRGFVPHAFRGVLVAMLVMCLADGMALSTFGILFSLEAHAMQDLQPVGLFFWVGAILMGICAWGLLRLRTWAVMLNVLANIAVAGTAWYFVCNPPFVPKFLAWTLTATASGQLLALLPLLSGMVRGRVAPAQSLGRGPLIKNLVVSGLICILLVSALPLR